MTSARQAVLSRNLPLQPRPASSGEERLKELREQHAKVRKLTDALCEALEVADLVVQAMPDGIPAKWHLAHTVSFFECFLLADPARGRTFSDRPFDPAFNSLFISYCNAVGGARHPRQARHDHPPDGDARSRVRGARFRGGKRSHRGRRQAALSDLRDWWEWTAGGPCSPYPAINRLKARSVSTMESSCATRSCFAAARPRHRCRTSELPTGTSFHRRHDGSSWEHGSRVTPDRSFPR